MFTDEEKDGYTFFLSYWQAVKAMPNKELQGDFLLQLNAYRFDGIMPDFKEPIQQASFALIKPVVDKQLKDKLRKRKQKSVDSTDNPEVINGKSTENPRKIHGNFYG